MRPYLAIIKDSFREALASRVLWTLLILITLGLVALAPLGFRTERTTEFREGDFLNAREMVRELVRQYGDGGPSPGHRIVSLLSSEARQRLTKFGEDEDGRSASYFLEFPKIIEDLNGLLTQTELYQETDWEDVLLGSEAREFLDTGPANLSPEELARLNRLLIEVPFEDYFRLQPPTQLVLTYGGAGVSPPIRVSERRVVQIIEQMVMPAIVGFLVGFLGVFAAILVTAPIIPQMFDPGALSLLLSKPLSRSLMFLAKFAGGCAFIFINVTYLIVGLWLIAGLRFDIWNQGLLLCIPIFLFLFVIYYSISALTGVIWRNAIICVVMTVLFWLACTIVGITKGAFEQFAVEMKRMVTLVEAGDMLIGVDETGGTKRWNEDEQQWDDTFIASHFGQMGRVLGPVYDPEKKVIMAARAANFGMFGNGRPLLIGKESDGWTEIEGPTLPEGTIDLLPDPQGPLLVVTQAGVERLVGDLEAKEKLKVFFMEIPQTIGKPFQPAGPEPALDLETPAAAAVNRQSGDIVVYGRGTLRLLTANEDEYEVAAKVDIEVDEEEGACVAFGGQTVLLALGDGRLLQYRVPDLTLQSQSQPESASQARFAVASPDGNWFGIVFHNGRLYLLDARQQQNSQPRLADVRGQGDVSAVLFSEDNAHILVVDRAKRVSEYDLETLDRTRSFAPQLTPLEIGYYYAVVPIYTVFPKPGELDNTVQYLLKKDETISVGMQSGDLQAKRLRLRPWAPVRSSAIFVLVILAVACVYIERQDF